jgi:hypothetical protein
MVSFTLRHTFPSQPAVWCYLIDWSYRFCSENKTHDEINSGGKSGSGICKVLFAKKKQLLQLPTVVYVALLSVEEFMILVRFIN